MRSALPKVMHELAGEPLLAHVIATARALLESREGRIYVVTGHGREWVDPLVEESGCQAVYQDSQLGTGHAVLVALDELSPDGQTLVLYGDVPLIQGHDLEPLLSHTRDALGVLTAKVPDPTGYGRIIRASDGSIQKIVEHRDANPTQLAIDEINSGIYAGPTALFKQYLAQVSNDNAQGEFYLTDCVSLATRDSQIVHPISAPATSVQGVNDREQLATLNRQVQTDRRVAAMHQGVTLVDPETVYLNGSIKFETDVTIEPNVVLNGPVHIGEGARIGFGSVITESTVAPYAVLKPYSIIESGTVGEAASVGPFARVRPGTVLEANTHLGNFCETKNARVGAGSKINHLSYVGDATIGQNTNIGAGTITCNYDGANKHLTTLGDRVFIGSNTSLIAPVTVGDDATTGAGSVISQDVSPGALGLSRPKQIERAQYQRPQKIKE